MWRMRYSLRGTAAGVSPVVEVDRRPVGNGKVGEITKKIQKCILRPRKETIQNAKIG